MPRGAIALKKNPNKMWKICELFVYIHTSYARISIKSVVWLVFCACEFRRIFRLGLFPDVFILLKMQCARKICGIVAALLKSHWAGILENICARKWSNCIYDDIFVTPQDTYTSLWSNFEPSCRRHEYKQNGMGKCRSFFQSNREKKKKIVEIFSSLLCKYVKCVVSCK